MNDASKVKPNHLQRAAYVYIRQSSPAQVENNRESTARQYDLVEKVYQLGWAKEHVIVVDEDLGRSGSGWVERSGFAHLTTEVAMGRAGIVLGLGSLALGTQQCRLVSLVRSVWRDRYSGGGWRRRLSSGAFQRPTRSRLE